MSNLSLDSSQKPTQRHSKTPAEDFVVVRGQFVKQREQDKIVLPAGETSPLSIKHKAYTNSAFKKSETRYTTTSSPPLHSPVTNAPPARPFLSHVPATPNTATHIWPIALSQACRQVRHEYLSLLREKLLAKWTVKVHWCSLPLFLAAYPTPETYVDAPAKLILILSGCPSPAPIGCEPISNQVYCEAHVDVLPLYAMQQARPDMRCVVQRTRNCSISRFTATSPIHIGSLSKILSFPLLEGTIARVKIYLEVNIFKDYYRTSVWAFFKRAGASDASTWKHLEGLGLLKVEGVESSRLIFEAEEDKEG